MTPTTSTTACCAWLFAVYDRKFIATAAMIARDRPLHPVAGRAAAPGRGPPWGGGARKTWVSRTDLDAIVRWSDAANADAANLLCLLRYVRTTTSADRVSVGKPCSPIIDQAS